MPCGDAICPNKFIVPWRLYCELLVVTIRLLGLLFDIDVNPAETQRPNHGQLDNLCRLTCLGT